MFKFKKILNVMAVAIALMVSMVAINADTMAGYSMKINNQSVIQAQAGETFVVNLSIGSQQADIFELRIPKPMFGLVQHDKDIIDVDATNDDEYILTINLGREKLINNANSTSFTISSNHELIRDGLQVQLIPTLTQPDQSVVVKEGLTINFSNPTVYDVTTFERVAPEKKDPVVPGELVTYGLAVSATAPKTSLKNAVVTLPVPTGFSLGASEPGNLNSHFTQPGGPGTPLISNSQTIGGGWSGIITGSYPIDATPSVVSAPEAPSVRGSIVGIDQNRPSSLAPLQETIGTPIVKIFTDLKPYAETNTLMIDSPQHNVGDKLFAAFIWNDSNITVKDTTFNIDVADGYKVMGVRTPKFVMNNGQTIIHRFESNTTFIIKMFDDQGQLLATSAPLSQEQDFTPTLSGSVKSIAITVSSMRPGDGTRTKPPVPGLYNFRELAGFKVMGTSISTYNDTTPVQEGDMLKVDANVVGYTQAPSHTQVQFGPSTLAQKATKIPEYMMLPVYSSTNNFLQREEALKIKYRLEIDPSIVYTNYPGVEGPEIFLVSPHNTTFAGDVENGDFSSAIIPGNGFKTPIITYVKTLPDGRQVLKITYSSDPNSPNYNQVVTNRKNNRDVVVNTIFFDTNLVVNKKVMYGTRTPVWSNMSTGVIFFNTNQKASYQDTQSNVPDTFNINNGTPLVANGYINNRPTPHVILNNRTPLTFIGPNQLSGDNAQRNSLSDYNVYDSNDTTNDTLALFSKATTLTGTYRTNLYNGLSGDIDNIVQYLPLPQRDSSSMTIRLTGPITPPQGSEVLYSTSLVDVKPGSAIDETSFVPEANLNGDYSNVKSILFKVARLATRANSLIEIPIEIANPETAIVGEVALTSTSITATNSLDGTVVYVEGINQLATKYLAQKAKLVVTKVDSEDKTIVLKGAQFDVTGPDGFKQTLTTNDLGQIELTDLEFGTYTFTETQAPEGYRRLTQPVTIVVDQEVTTHTISNTKLTDDDFKATLTITKVDGDDPTLKLAGAQFRISGPSGYSHDATTNAQGQIVLENLDFGDYTIIETQAPDGYQPLTDAITLTLNQANQAITIENYAQSSSDNKARLTLIKVDKDDPSKTLAGARFTITGPEGYRFEATTNAQGQIALEDLDFGDYTITETQAPTGYQKLTAPIQFELAQAVDTLTIENSKDKGVTSEKATLVITKVDGSDNTKTLNNVRFKIEGPQGYSHITTTDAKGTITISDLAYGQYTITELKTAQGYILLSEPVVVTLDQERVALTIANDREAINPLKAVLTITKVDANDEAKRLANASFVLKGPGGVVYEGITNAQGQIEWINLEPGVYTLVETAAPDGYKLDGSVQQITLKAGSNTMTIRNQKESTLPQTGYRNDAPMIALGLILSGLGVLYLGRRRRKTY